MHSLIITFIGLMTTIGVGSIFQYNLDMPIITIVGGLTAGIFTVLYIANHEVKLVKTARHAAREAAYNQFGGKQ